MEKIAFGRLSMSSREFLKATPRQFRNRLIGFNELETERGRQAWERTRLLAYSMQQFDPKKPVPKITDWMPFLWDEKEQPTDPRKNPELQELFAAWDADINKD